MNDVTQILNDIGQGDLGASDRLLPVVYQELRQLAAKRLANEKSGQTIQPTVLVHEAYLRLVDVPNPQQWNGRGHFYGAAAEAMRRILIENARRRQSLKRGGQLQRVEVADFHIDPDHQIDDLLSLDEALTEFEQQWPERARLVKLRYFVGLTIAEAADAMGVSRVTADRYWKFAKTWLYAQLNK